MEKGPQDEPDLWLITSRIMSAHTNTTLKNIEDHYEVKENSIRRKTASNLGMCPCSGCQR